jgi:hypothetical protein
MVLAFAADSSEGRHALAQLVMQLARERAPLFLEPRLYQLREFPVLFQLDLGLTRAHVLADALLEAGRHAVERVAHGLELGQRVVRQAHVVAPALHVGESGEHARERP